MMIRGCSDTARTHCGKCSKTTDIVHCNKCDSTMDSVAHSASLEDAAQKWILAYCVPSEDADLTAIVQAADSVDPCSISGSARLLVAQCARSCTKSRMAAEWFAAAFEDDSTRADDEYTGLAELAEEVLCRPMHELLHLQKEARIDAFVTLLTHQTGEGGEEEIRPPKHARVDPLPDAQVQSCLPIADAVEYLRKQLRSSSRSDEGEGSIVQTLMYFSDALCVRKHGKVLMASRAEAYRDGPVYPEARIYFKQTSSRGPKDVQLAAPHQALLDAVLQSTKGLSQADLIAAAHEEAPWLACGENQVIAEADMLYWYATRRSAAVNALERGEALPRGSSRLAASEPASSSGAAGGADSATSIH
jgi:uncharacterized phage-associated protein